MSDQGTIKVSVVVITYNQEKYIRQALDSIVMQKVNFPMEVLVGDDASDDSTPNIIREYRNRYPGLFRIKLRKKNVGSTKNSYALYKRTRGEYVAMLEGDDYWTDPLKLQKQADFLDQHQEYYGCTTNFRYVDEDGVEYGETLARSLRQYSFSENKVYTIEEFRKSLRPSHSGTLFFRNIFREDLDTSILVKADRYVGDTTLALMIAAHSPIYRLEDNCADYRRALKEGVSFTSRERSFAYSAYEIFMAHKRIENYAKGAWGIDAEIKKDDWNKFFTFAENAFRYPSKAKKACVKNMLKVSGYRAEYLRLLLWAYVISRLSGLVADLTPLAADEEIYDKLDKTWNDFERAIIGKTLILYGAGDACVETVNNYYHKYRARFIVDRDPRKNGVFCMGMMVRPLEALYDLKPEQTVILITTTLHFREAAATLDEMGYHNYFSYGVMERKRPQYNLLRLFDKELKFMRGNS